MSASDTPVTRRSPRILIRYLAAEFLLPLFCCLASFCLLFVILDLFDVLQDLIEAKASAWNAVSYFILRQPGNLVLILPMSLLLSAGYLVTNLLRHHELTAIRAAGLSLVRACTAVWVAGVLLAVVSFWLSEMVVPRCTGEADVLLQRLTQRSAARIAASQRLAFRNSVADRDWFFERFDVKGRQAGVWVKQFRPDHGIAWEIQAESATYEAGTWIFAAGTRMEYDEDGLLPKDAGKPFATFELVGEGESPREILSSLKPAEDLAVRDMLRILQRNPNLPASTRNVFLTTLWFRIVFPFSCLVAVLLGVALPIGSHGGSRLRGLALAVGLMVAYVVLGQLFVLFGKNGFLPPVIAGAGPTVFFLFWGGLELWRKR